MKEISGIYVKVNGDFVAVKITKHEATKDTTAYYEWTLEKVYKEKGNADFKEAGETFTGADLETVFYRINSYVNELNRAGVESKKVNPNF